MSLVLIVTLALGVFAGMFAGEGVEGFTQLSSWLLLVLVFSVGIDIGMNRDAFVQIKKMGVKILVIPLCVAVGSLLGGVAVALITRESVKECLAISSGMGWYSLSGIMITEAGNPVAGAISFLSNVIREILTFVVVPFLAKYLNFYCAIAPGGATAMDTTLAVISRNTNGKIAVIAFVSGITLTMIVPVLLPLFL